MPKIHCVSYKLQGNGAANYVKLKLKGCFYLMTILLNTIFDIKIKNNPKSTTPTCKGTQIKYIKRYMLNSATKAVTKTITVVSETQATKIVSENVARNASYLARDTKAETTSHEHAEVNPILGKSPEKAFQHPTYTKILCTDINCENNLCKEPCGPLKEIVDVGHATHDPNVPKVTYVADTDLDGKSKTQFGVFYENPVAARAEDVAKTVNQARTDQLNNDEIHLVNVHANAKISSGNDETIN